MKLREILQEMLRVQKDIKVSTPMICGGTPRDKYMNRLDRVSDIDITTGDKTVHYLAEEFSSLLNKKFNTTIRTMDDGHSTIFIGNLKIDFSSNFMVQNIDNLLKNKIINPTNMQKEMFSRDFTCNALLLSLDLKSIIDPTNMGFADIKEKKIKTCLSPEITLTTNKNRVIRAIYLASKLGFDIDDSIIDYVRKNPQSVKIASKKSLSEKLNSAFKWDSEKAAHFITEMNLWNYIPITEVVYPYYMKSVKGKIHE